MRNKFFLFIFLILNIFLCSAFDKPKHVYIPRSWMSVDELIADAQKQSGIQIRSKIKDSEKKYVLYDNLTTLSQVVAAIQEYYYFVLGVETDVFEGPDHISIIALPPRPGVDEAIARYQQFFLNYDKGISKGVAIVKDDLIEILPLSKIKKHQIYRQGEDDKFTLLPNKFHIRRVGKDYYKNKIDKVELDDLEMSPSDNILITAKSKTEENVDVTIQKKEFFLARLYTMLRNDRFRVKNIKAIEFEYPRYHNVVLGEYQFSIHKDINGSLEDVSFSMLPDTKLNNSITTFENLPGIKFIEPKSFSKEKIKKYFKDFKLKFKMSSRRTEEQKKPSITKSFFKKGTSRVGKKEKPSKLKFFSFKMFPKSDHQIEIIRKPLRRTTLRAHRDADKLFDDLRDDNRIKDWELRRRR